VYRGDGTGEYVFGPAGLQQRTVGAASQYAQGDGLGSVRLITNGAGAAAGSASFEPWGAPRAGSASLGGFGFTGEQADAETGLVYLRARHYDPATGRFVQQDSYAGAPGNPQGQNRFAYAEGNPVRHTDPSGHTVFDPGMAGDFGYGPPIAGAAGALAIGAWLQQNKEQVDQFWQTTTNSVSQWWNQLCSSGGTPYVFQPGKDEDLRGHSFQEALDRAFKNTGVPREDFEITDWAPGPNGKEIPVEWKGPGGAEVSIDFPHTGDGPRFPHIGWQGPGKKSGSGHIWVDDVPGGRGPKK
jgi:RHS repeat-associated protein